MKLNFFPDKLSKSKKEHKRNKAQIYDGMIQVYFSVFEGRRN